MNNPREWFEMLDLKRKDIQRDSWVPLCRDETKVNDVQYGHVGHQKEYLGAVAVIFSSVAREEALKCNWSSITPSFGHRPRIDGEEFISACRYISSCSDLCGVYPVLQLSYDGLEHPEWLLHHDIVTGLGLKQEGDIWVCPEDDYIDVARIDRNVDGAPSCLRIRTQYLRDFLCARSSGLMVSTFQCRDEISANDPDYGLEAKDIFDKEHSWCWRGFVQAIHKGGFPFGKKIAVLHSARTSVDPKDDVPVFPSIGEDSFESSSWEKRYSGKKLYRISGEMWRNHWVEPGSLSPRVREDEEESDIQFISDSSGKTLSGRALENHRGWLWFKPAIVTSILSRRAGVLSWFTEYTGQLGTSSVHAVHFGVNRLGLINVFAKDIAQMPTLHQKIWASYNVLPDGGLSKELYMAQMRAEPASTMAPEALLASALQHFRRVSNGLLGHCFLRRHDDELMLLRQIHRFRGESIASLFSLAKDLTKVSVEQFDQDVLRTLVQNNKGLASIKLLERFLDSLGFNGRKITAPLVGVYELRHGDAHLASSDVSNSLDLLGLKDDGNYQSMAKHIIEKVAYAVGAIGDLIIKSKEKS